MQSRLITNPLRLTAFGTRIRVSTEALLLAFVAIIIATLAVHFAVYLRYALTATRYPFELFDAEGIVWQQATLIPGESMYGDINRFPFIVFHYPPVYHLAVRAVAALGLNPLLAGRSISLAASLVTGALAASLAFRATRSKAGRIASLAGGATAGLVFFCFLPVVACSPLMRVDMLAIALSFLGIWFATESVSRPRLLFVAMTFFVLATFTKQTCVAASLATMAVMVLVNPRLTMKVSCYGLLLGTTALLVLTWSTHGGFLRHIVLYNINRFSFVLLAHELLEVVPQLGFVALALVSIVIGWKQLREQRTWKNAVSLRRDLASDEAVRLMALLTLYFALSTCTLVTLGKSGAGLNYFVEWMGILSVLIGTLVATVVGHQVVKPGSASPVLAVAVLLILMMQVLRSPASWDFGFADVSRSQQLRELVTKVSSAPGPVLSDDMILLMKAGKQVPWEPAIFGELARTGQWDERKIINLISDHYFDFVITNGHDNLYTPAVATAIATAYPRTEEYAGHTVHFSVEGASGTVSTPLDASDK